MTFGLLKTVSRLWCNFIVQLEGFLEEEDAFNAFEGRNLKKNRYYFFE